MAAFKHELEGGDEILTGQQLGADPLDIFSDKPQVTLGWDPSLSAVDSYKILFRVHGTAEWFLLSQITAVPDPQFIVSHADIGNGMFDFGIIVENEYQTPFTSVERLQGALFSSLIEELAGKQTGAHPPPYYFERPVQEYKRFIHGRVLCLGT